jgi:hypothetical protein
MSEVQTAKYTHLRFDDNAQALLFRLSGLYRGIRIHIDRGQVTVSACGGSLPRFLLRGEFGDDPSEVVRRFAREFVRRCAENAADSRYTPEWQNEWGFWADYIGELLERSETHE